MTTLINRTVVVGGRRTSMRLEPEMWEAIRDICHREDMTISEFCSIVDQHRGKTGLTAATRVFLLLYFRNAASSDGVAGGCRFDSLRMGVGAPNANQRWPFATHDPA